MSVTYSGGSRKFKDSSKKKSSCAKRKNSSKASKEAESKTEVSDDDAPKKKKPSYLKKKKQQPATQMSIKAGYVALDVLVKASKGHHLAELLYQDQYGRKSRRSIEPYSLRFIKGNWKVFGFCMLRKELRCFDLKSILTCLVRSETYEPRYPVTLEQDCLNMRTHPL